MKREIKFRGLAIKNSDEDNEAGIWVYGDYRRLDPDTDVEDHRIYWYRNNESYCASIIPETVGQFTGLKDKNGKEIYEGDHFGNENFYVVFYKGCFMLGGLPLIGYLNGEYFEQVETIQGNIHENKELLS